jgi:hypothetical protein
MDSGALYFTRSTTVVSLAARGTFAVIFPLSEAKSDLSLERIKE